jgi:hypothetical protein
MTKPISGPLFLWVALKRYAWITRGICLFVYITKYFFPNRRDLNHMAGWWQKVVYRFTGAACEIWGFHRDANEVSSFIKHSRGLKSWVRHVVIKRVILSKSVTFMLNAHSVYGKISGLFKGFFYHPKFVGCDSYAVEFCILLGCGAASLSDWRPTFRDNILTSSSRVYKSE